MKVEYRMPKPEWEGAAASYARDYHSSPERWLYPSQIDYVRAKMKKSDIAEELVIVGEIVYYDYDKFECVVLAEDGTYHKIGLDKVKVIKDDSENN